LDFEFRLNNPEIWGKSDFPVSPGKNTVTEEKKVLDGESSEAREEKAREGMEKDQSAGARLAAGILLFVFDGSLINSSWLNGFRLFCVVLLHAHALLAVPCPMFPPLSQLAHAPPPGPI
jgi:hypothetical protein